MKHHLKFKIFRSRTCIWKYRLRNGTYFDWASMCYGGCGLDYFILFSNSNSTIERKIKVFLLWHHFHSDPFPKVGRLLFLTALDYPGIMLDMGTTITDTLLKTVPVQVQHIIPLNVLWINITKIFRLSTWSIFLSIFQGETTSAMYHTTYHAWWNYKVRKYYIYIWLSNENIFTRYGNYPHFSYGIIMHSHIYLT